MLSTYYFKSISDYDIIFNGLMDYPGPIKMDTDYKTYISPLTAETDETIFQICDDMGVQYE